MRRVKITKIYNKKKGTIPTKCTAPLSLFIVLAKRLKSIPALFTRIVLSISKVYSYTNL